MDELFTLDTTPAPWVVRHAVTGTEYLRTTDPLECELWCDAHRDHTWLVIEPADQCLSLDKYMSRGMLRNYPGERRRATNAQLDLFAIA